MWTYKSHMSKIHTIFYRGLGMSKCRGPPFLCSKIVEAKIKRRIAYDRRWKIYLCER